MVVVVVLTLVSILAMSNLEANAAEKQEAQQQEIKSFKKFFFREDKEFKEFSKENYWKEFSKKVETLEDDHNVEVKYENKTLTLYQDAETEYWEVDIYKGEDLISTIDYPIFYETKSNLHIVGIPHQQKEDKRRILVDYQPDIRLLKEMGSVDVQGNKEIVYAAKNYSIVREENGYSLFRLGKQLASTEFPQEISGSDFARGYTLTSEGEFYYINIGAKANYEFLDIVKVDDGVESLQEETFRSNDYSIPVYSKGDEYYVALPNDPRGHRVYNGENYSTDVAEYYKGIGYTTVKLASDRLIVYLEYLDTIVWKRHYKLFYKGVDYGELVVDSSIDNNFLNDVLDLYYQENPEKADLRWNTFSSLITCEEIEAREAAIQEFMDSWAEQHKDYTWGALDKYKSLSMSCSYPRWGVEQWKQNHPRQ